MIIIAGYEDKMKDSFLKANEGLDRRFPNQFVFPPYTPQQLVDILKRMLEKYDLLQKWEPDVWTQLRGLAELCMLHSENRKDPGKAADPNFVSAAPFYDELFSKQGGSMENLANQIVTYCALPDKNPARWGRSLYVYDPDMIAVLASKLDRKWHSGLNDRTSLVQRVLRAPLPDDPDDL
jgi:Cdc6-like AAA superfamily ATPase